MDSYDILDFYNLVSVWALGTLIIFFISAIDDFFIDIVYWVRRAYRYLFNKTYKVFNINILKAQVEKRVAIMVPAWREDDVIAQMLETNIKYLDYKKYVFFVGVYKNDAATNAEVDKVAAKYKQVQKVVVPHDGPTCKADCLNWVIQHIFLYEKENKKDFDFIVYHDAEDVIHPLELLLFNYMIRKKDFIQIPVRALERDSMNWVSGIYMDEFAESHGKDLVVRGVLCGIVPSAGVASCFSKKAIKRLAKDNDGIVFNSDSLTEDYDISYRLAKYKIKQIFADFKIDVGFAKNIYSATEKSRKVQSIAVAEYFPSKLWTAVRQRTRWNIGIFYQSASRLTWEGGFFNKYYFFRDRKGIVVNFLALPSYLLLFTLVGLSIGYQFFGLPRFDPNFPLWIFYSNVFFFLFRIFSRVYFTAESYSLKQGLLGIPRIFVANLINFLSTFRATYIYTKSKIQGKAIAWDKTQHEYPSMEALKKAEEVVKKTTI